MSNLTSKQKVFCEEYVANFGNGTQAAIKAGYSERSAAELARKNLKKPHVRSYIEELMATMHNERMMSAEEALAIAAAIVRGEPQQFIYQEIDGQTGELIAGKKKLSSADFKDRNKALEYIFKVHGSFIDKKETKSKVESPIFIDDVPSDDDG